MTFKKTALASAISIVFAAEAAATAYIPQISTEDLTQNAENIIELASGMDIALELGLDGVGSTQIASQQLNTIGWGQTGGSATSALDISVAHAVLEQTLGQDDLIIQSITNAATGAVDSDRVASIELRGLSQIGANAANAAAVNFGEGANSLDLHQNAYFDDIGEDTAELDQSVFNVIDGLIAGNGEVVIDGGYLNADGETVSSVQFGTNTVNSAQANAVGSLGVKLEQWATDTNSTIANVASAQAHNEYGADPAISNLDQIGTTTINALSLTSDAEMQLSPEVMFDRVPEASFSSDVAQRFTDSGDNFRMANEMTALNGYLVMDGTDVEDIVGMQGDSMIDSVGQTLVISVNSVSASGQTTTETVDGVDVTTTADAGALTVGIVDPAGDVHSFDQILDNGLYLQPGWSQLQLEGPHGETLRYEDGIGNLLTAMTGVGTASVTDFSQVQSVSANTFSTSGDLKGASQASLDYDTSDLETVYSDLNVDLGQVVEGTVDVAVVNIAAAYTDDNGPAIADGSQTAAFTLNSLSASGDAAGYFGQLLEADGTTDVLLRNRLDAITDERGAAYVGDRLVGGELISAPVAQTAVSSINSMAFGSLGDGAVVQLPDRELTQEGLNAVNVGTVRGIGNLAQAANVTQAVINRVNTIAAINP